MSRESEIYWTRIEEYKRKLNLSWAQVAARVGVSVGMLMMVKTGKRRLGRKAIDRFNTTEGSDDGGIGGRVQELRERKRLSVPKFAAAIGFDRSHVYRIEKGQARNPTLDFIEAVARTYGVDREWLIGGKANQNPMSDGRRDQLLKELDALEVSIKNIRELLR